MRKEKESSRRKRQPAHRHEPEPAPGTGARAGERRKEIGGPEGPEPTRYDDWERNGRCIDF